MKRKEIDALDDSMIVELYLSRDESAIKHTSEIRGACDLYLASRYCRRQKNENDIYRSMNTIPRMNETSLCFPANHDIFLNYCRPRRFSAV